MAGKNYKIKKLSNFIDISSSMKNKQHQNILPLKSFIYHILFMKYFFFFCYDFNQNNENNN